MELEEHNEAIIEELSNPGREERSRSLLDLIEAGTFDLELAAWLVSKVSRGASWISGSGPGGIGKTTTMRSLLSFVPADRRLAVALPEKVTQLGSTPSCVISHELSDHPPATYLWGQDLRDFFAHADGGHVLVGNVHADDLDEIHQQVVGDNQVPEAQFRAVNLLMFICLEGGNPPGRRIKDTTTRRVVNKIFYSDGKSPHQSVFEPGIGLEPSAPRDAAYEAQCRIMLEEMLQDQERSLVEVRRRFLRS
jgi:hypothetical protein